MHAFDEQLSKEFISSVTEFEKITAERCNKIIEQILSKLKSKTVPSGL